MKLRATKRTIQRIKETRSEVLEKRNKTDIEPKIKSGT